MLGGVVIKEFQESLRRQEYLNSLEGSVIYGVNKFSDLTVEEFKGTHTMYINISTVFSVAQYLSGLQPSGVIASKVHSSGDVNIPKTFDW